MSKRVVTAVAAAASVSRFCICFGSSKMPIIAFIMILRSKKTRLHCQMHKFHFGSLVLGWRYAGQTLRRWLVSFVSACQQQLVWRIQGVSRVDDEMSACLSNASCERLDDNDTWTTWLQMLPSSVDSLFAEWTCLLVCPSPELAERDQDHTCCREQRYTMAGTFDQTVSSVEVGAALSCCKRCCCVHWFGRWRRREER